MSAKYTSAAILALALGLAAAAHAQERLLIEGGTLIDGSGRSPVPDSAVLIEDGRITRVGRGGDFSAPAGTRILDASGKTVIPGFIDHHFHIADDPTMVPLFLAAGVTSARDPGAWMNLFDPVRSWKQENDLPGPRLFLCGPHLDGPNPAYPDDSKIILSPEEARIWVRRQVKAGATAIKVYFRLPVESIRATTEEADRWNIPVTSHLEIIDVRDAVEAGVDGVEHITSLGLALMPPMEAEEYRQAILKDNNARRTGRYSMWASIDPHGKDAAELAKFLAERHIFVDPNLAVFERRVKPGDADSEMEAKAWQNMRDYVGVLHKAGVPIVVGSHSNAPYAERGTAYHREMETLVEAGMTPLEVLRAAGEIGADFLRRDDLGEIAEGKLGDVLILDADPLENISNARKIHRVIVNGQVIDPAAIPPLIMKK